MPYAACPREASSAFFNAPDVSMQNPGLVRTYTANAGEMTLVVSQPPSSSAATHT
jgi:hypothetical protein